MECPGWGTHADNAAIAEPAGKTSAITPNSQATLSTADMPSMRQPTCATASDYPGSTATQQPLHCCVPDSSGTGPTEWPAKTSTGWGFMDSEAPPTLWLRLRCSRENRFMPFRGPETPLRSSLHFGWVRCGQGIPPKCLRNLWMRPSFSLPSDHSSRLRLKRLSRAALLSAEAFI